MWYETKIKYTYVNMRKIKLSSTYFTKPTNNLDNYKHIITHIIIYNQIPQTQNECVFW